ncbi:MAG: T9SS type A sorting domain-containing protein, partial [Ignavibacteria bacterium]|nr:T9SS type A sorting domain-containing protein [Ignavibacteria bacterium]
AGCFDPVDVTCTVSDVSDEEWDALWTEHGFESELVSADHGPVETMILGNYPNPFNPSTTIRYQIGVDAPVSVKIFNMLGQEVATLVDGFQKAGVQSATWHGVNDFGQAVSSGLYIYRIQVGSQVMTEKMLFMK